jgi:hypothetical protein
MTMAKYRVKSKTWRNNHLYHPNDIVELPDGEEPSAGMELVVEEPAAEPEQPAEPEKAAAKPARNRK